MAEEPQPVSRIIESAFLCDHAVDYGGRLSALGLFANLVQAPAIPTMHSLTLVLRVGWLANRLVDVRLALTIRVTGPTGDELAVVEMTGEIDDQDLEHPEIATGINTILPLVFGITMAGVHQVEIYFEEDLMESIPFKVVTGGQ